MHPNAERITQFYQAFQQRDAVNMNRHYHARVNFSDAVFVGLQGAEVGAMWAMLCERGKDLQIVFSDVQADTTQGQAHWEATYTFSRTGRKVHNIIEARFKFAEDGTIIDHQDSFNFWRWSRQALGTTGLVLGWTPFLQKKVQAQSRAALMAYMAKNG